MNKTAIEALAACAEIEQFVIAIERYEEYTDGQPNLGTCKNLGAIKIASKKAREALAAIETKKTAEVCHCTRSGNIDEDIRPIVDALNDAGIKTIASCCGHTFQPSSVILEHNGVIKELRLFTFEQARKVEKLFPDINGESEKPANESARDEAVNDFRMDELDAVMHSVDKWLEGDALKNNPATRAADAREIALKAIEAETARADRAKAALKEVWGKLYEIRGEPDKLNAIIMHERAAIMGGKA